jgi:hypothetical protein
MPKNDNTVAGDYTIAQAFRRGIKKARGKYRGPFLYVERMISS